MIWDSSAKGSEFGRANMGEAQVPGATVQGFKQLLLALNHLRLGWSAGITQQVDQFLGIILRNV